MNAEYEKLQLSDKDCVLEAVAATYKRQLIPINPILEIFKDDEGIMERVLKKAIKDEGGHASIHVLYHLLSNFAEQFSDLMLLESQISLNPDNEEELKSSFYFLVKSLQGNWFAGSPTYNSKDTPQLIHASSELGKVLEGIGNEAGDIWPSQEFVLNHVNGSSSEPGYISNHKMPYVVVRKLTMHQSGPRTSWEELHVRLAKKHHE